MKLLQLNAYLASQAFYWTVLVVAGIATVVLLGLDYYKERRNDRP